MAKYICTSRAEHQRNFNTMLGIRKCFPSIPMGIAYIRNMCLWINSSLLKSSISINIIIQCVRVDIKVTNYKLYTKTKLIGYKTYYTNKIFNISIFIILVYYSICITTRYHHMYMICEFLRR